MEKKRGLRNGFNFVFNWHSLSIPNLSQSIWVKSGRFMLII